MNSSNYTIRQLLPAEALHYKSLRLEALQKQPGFFSNSYAMETAFEEDYWTARVHGPNCAIFGLFCNNDLIGITGITIMDDNADTAYLNQSYIRAEHRGKGHSRMLYDARIQWAKDRGIHRLIVGHRANNLVSKAANQRYGFTYAYSEPRKWPDGGTDEMLFYELTLF